MNRIALILGLGLASAAVAAPRDVQFRSIDLVADIIELHNFGSTAESLTGWRFCTHDFNEQRRYTAATGFGARTLAPGASLFIHVLNNAPMGDANRINLSSLGGQFALPLDQDAYGLQIFNPDANGNVSFASTTLLADHVQWNIPAELIGTAQSRTAQAVTAGVWTAVGAFVTTQADTIRITLTDTTGAALHGPANYAVTNPAVACNAADLSEAFGTLDINDVLAFANAFNAQGALADFFPDGMFDINDVLVFATEFNNGCP